MVKHSWSIVDTRKIRWSGHSSWALGVVVLWAGMVGISGCGPGDGRQAVTGMVTVDGEPLDDAAISFQAAHGTKGPSSGGPVQDGKYRVSARKGLLPGTYKVTIIAMKKTGKMINDPQKGRVPELVQVRFREVPGEVTVVAGETHEFPFDLTSAP